MFELNLDVSYLDDRYVIIMPKYIKLCVETHKTQFLSCPGGSGQVGAGWVTRE